MIQCVVPLVFRNVFHHNFVHTMRGFSHISCVVTTYTFSSSLCSCALSICTYLRIFSITKLSQLTERMDSTDVCMYERTCNCGGDITATWSKCEHARACGCKYIYILQDIQPLFSLAIYQVRPQSIMATSVLKT